MSTKEIKFNLGKEGFANSPKAMDTPFIKVAAYIRVSTDTADQENSYAAQERYFNSLLAHNSTWVSAGIYSDYGISGTSDKGRIGFKRIMRHCREGKIDRIICKSISRFARNTKDFMTALAILRANNISIFFERENIDTAKSSNDFILTALGAFAQEESRSISENVRRSIKQRYSSGIACNRDIYGYRALKGGGVEIVKEEASVIRRIFNGIADGKSYIEVARELNKEKIPPPETIYSRKHRNMRLNISPARGELSYDINKGWTARNIANIIKLERYTGDVLLQKYYVSDYITHKTSLNTGELPKYLVRNHHPAIIEHELFDRVQKIRNGNSQKYSTDGIHNTYQFSKFIVCGHCGRFYTVRKYRGKTVWFCPTSALNNGLDVCSAHSIKEETLVNICTEAFKKRFIKFNTLDETYDTESIIQEIEYKLENALNTDNIERDCYFLMQEDKERYSAIIQHMINYKEELENNSDNIRHAVEWIKTLQHNKDAINSLIAGFSQEHLKAFMFYMTVCEDGKYRFYWFDDKETTIEAA